MTLEGLLPELALELEQRGYAWIGDELKETGAGAKAPAAAARSGAAQ